jgi:hypothetical protein
VNNITALPRSYTSKVNCFLISICISSTSLHPSFDNQEQVEMPSHYEMARAPHRPATAHVNIPSWTPRHMYPLLTSSTAGVASSDVKAFDVEVAMAKSIMDPNPDARPRHFRNLFQECIFVFTVMMSTASTVSVPEAPSTPC